jgi:hypothetical protein
MAAITERLDEYGKGAWIALTVLGFCVFWPLGLATLVFLMCSGRTRAWKMESRGRWYNTNCSTGGWGGGSGWKRDRQASSGNVAFDEYRRETLKRLEEEQREFTDYLDRLRAAKDKSEFEQFMAERRNRPPEATAQA